MTRPAADPGGPEAAGTVTSVAAAGAAAGPECVGPTCLTCSDQAVPVRVVRLLPDRMALVDTGAGQERVSVALVSARVGGTLLVHAGEAIAAVTEEEDW